MCCSPNREPVPAATHYHNWAKHTDENVISPLLYTFLSSTPGLNGNEALCCHVLMGMKPTASDWSTISRIATRKI